MALITATDYEEIIGDLAPEEFDTLYDMAIAYLERFCGRPLESRQRYEVAEVYGDHRAYPNATPVTQSLDGYPHNTTVITTPATGFVELSYVGGYGQLGDTTHPEPCPSNLAMAIAHAISTLADPTAQVDDSTSTSVAGEYSVTRNNGTIRAADGTPLSADLLPFAVIGGVALILATPWRRAG